MKKIFSFLLISISIFSISCSDKDNDSDTGPITLEFDNIVGSANLEFNTSYTNSKSEEYKLTSLSYYVSGIKLKRSDGTVFTDPATAPYLVDEDDAESQEITIQNVPSGDYTEVTFTIGGTGSQAFLETEGTSPVSKEDNNVFQYHISGDNNKTITLSFNGNSAPVRAQHEPEAHLLFDVNKLFNGTGEQITFSENAIRTSPESCKDLANNIPAAFVVDHIHAN